MPSHAQDPLSIPIATYHATLFINHNKMQTDQLKQIPHSTNDVAETGESGFG